MVLSTVHPFRLFKDMTQAIEALRGALCLEDYLIRLSSVEILKLMRRLKDHRSQILDEIRLFRQQESDNQTSFLTYVSANDSRSLSGSNGPCGFGLLKRLYVECHSS